MDAAEQLDLEVSRHGPMAPRHLLELTRSAEQSLLSVARMFRTIRMNLLAKDWVLSFRESAEYRTTEHGLEYTAAQLELLAGVVSTLQIDDIDEAPPFVRSRV